MEGEIFVTPEEMWSYFQEKKDVLQSGNMIGIASNELAGIEVFLECDNGHPLFSVYIDDEFEYSEMAMDEVDCRYTVGRIYDDYIRNYIRNYIGKELDEIVEDVEEEEIPASTATIEDEIYERDVELDDALIDFLNVVLEKSTYSFLSFSDDELQDMKDHFLEYIARKYDIDIYRPMYLEGENGTEEFFEYPYGEISYEDEGNPIYELD